MDGEPIADEFDADIPVDVDEFDITEVTEIVEEGVEGGYASDVYWEPRSGPGPDLTDAAQDEHPSPQTTSL